MTFLLTLAHILACETYSSHKLIGAKSTLATFLFYLILLVELDNSSDALLRFEGVGGSSQKLWMTKVGGRINKSWNKGGSPHFLRQQIKASVSQVV